MVTNSIAKTTKKPIVVKIGSSIQLLPVVVCFRSEPMNQTIRDYMVCYGFIGVLLLYLSVVLSCSVFGGQVERCVRPMTLVIGQPFSRVIGRPS